MERTNTEVRVQPDEKQVEIGCNGTPDADASSGAAKGESQLSQDETRGRGLFTAADFPPVPDWARRPPGDGEATLFDAGEDDE
jgi:hypothetical protein